MKFLLRNGTLHEVHEIVLDGTRSVTIRGTMGVVTVRKNGKDGKLYERRPYGWGNIFEKRKEKKT